MTQGTKYDSFTDTVLSGTLTLTASSAKYQRVDPDGSARTVQLPDLRSKTTDINSEATGDFETDRYADMHGGFFHIENYAGGSEVLNIKGWNGTNTTTTLATPDQNESALCYWTGNSKGWVVDVVANA